LTVKVTWAVRRTKLAECADAMNFNWLKSHSAPPHRLAELTDFVRGHLLCHFELTAVCEERGTRNSQKGLIKKVEGVPPRIPRAGSADNVVRETAVVLPRGADMKPTFRLVSLYKQQALPSEEPESSYNRYWS
jgi:hypothetical protein